ncbi:MAG: phosphotransferase [Calditrichaeota bacterium]|nr:phosphotransferase [Calditrichota bacterium]
MKTTFILAENLLRLIKRGFEELIDHLNSNVDISLLDALMKIINHAVQRKRLLKLAMDALPRYDLQVDSIKFVGDSVNTVFEVNAGGARYALRIHPPKTYATEKIKAELLWLSALRADMSLMVPDPVPANDGTLVQKVSFPKKSGTRQVVMFGWLEGEFLGENLTPATMELAGSFMANLHNHTRKFRLPGQCSRRHFSWGELRRWQDVDTPGPEALTPDDFTLCMAAAKAVSEKIDDFIVETDYGLVHLDLTPWNYLLHRGEIGAIDFDDCQFAPFLYDMAVPLSYIDEHQDYQSLKDGFLRGYAHKRQLPQHHGAGLELFIVVRALYMINWILGWPSPSHQTFGPNLLAKALNQLSRYNI